MIAHEFVVAQLIADLISSAHDCALASVQDGGDHVDIIFSRLKGRENQVMTLQEAEQRIDRTIKRAYFALTGKRVVGDPFNFIQSSRPQGRKRSSRKGTVGSVS